MSAALKCPACLEERNCGLTERLGGASIYQCSDCGHEFAHPLTYSESYYEDAHSEDLGRIRLARMSRRDMWRKAPALSNAHHWEALRWLKAHLPVGSAVLDVGCGRGWFLALLERAGFVAIGTEVAKETVGALLTKGFQVHHGPVSQYPRDWPRPRSVTVFEVIEHVAAPAEFLREIREAFPAASLILSTPCPGRWTLRLGWRERVDYPPNHLHRWTVESLRRALLRAGYEDMRLVLPKVRAQEVYGEALHALFFLCGLKGINRKMPSTAGRSRRTRATEQLSALGGPIIWCYDRTLELSRAIFFPAAWYFNARGWASQSMVAIAFPAAAASRSLGVCESCQPGRTP